MSVARSSIKGRRKGETRREWIKRGECTWRPSVLLGRYLTARHKVISVVTVLVQKSQRPAGCNSQRNSDQRTDAPGQRRSSATAVDSSTFAGGTRAALSGHSAAGFRLASARAASETCGYPAARLTAGCKLKTFLAQTRRQCTQKAES